MDVLFLFSIATMERKLYVTNDNYHQCDLLINIPRENYYHTSASTGSPIKINVYSKLHCVPLHKR